ncbi:MAG: hypothetical protein H6740_20850 [Alphaproteobacteria bacterium]|nr:hypothetical protein [Alphaproteobacteria bacterium]
MTKTDRPAGALDARLRVARDRAQAMHDHTDQLNLALKRVEAALADLKLGVSAFVQLHVESDREAYGGPSWVQTLGFEKQGRQWRLMVWSGPDDGDEDEWQGNPLLDTSRITRERAADKLPELLDALIAEVDKKAQGIAARAAQVNQLAEQIEALVEGEGS